MVDGLLNKKIAFIIQARMQSTRLPGKILMPLPLGSKKPLLGWIVEELKKSKFQAEITVATSVHPSNDALLPFCEEQSIEIFRGDEEDVLSRFIAIVKKSNYDCVVRLTADNPIIDSNMLDEVITYHFENKFDYTSTNSLPTGMNFEVISSKALLDLENQVVTNSDKEHVTLFIRNNDRYAKGVYQPIVNPELQNLRLTMDYPSDYAMIAAVLTQALYNNKLKGIQLVEETFANYPWLFETNSANFQKRQFKNWEEELSEAIKLLKEHEFEKVVTVLSKIDT